RLAFVDADLGYPSLALQDIEKERELELGFNALPIKRADVHEISLFMKLGHPLRAKKYCHELAERVREHTRNTILTPELGSFKTEVTTFHNQVREPYLKLFDCCVDSDEMDLLVKSIQDLKKLEQEYKIPSGKDRSRNYLSFLARRVKNGEIKSPDLIEKVNRLTKEGL
ncbi:MAG: hypothetical protein K2X81_13920, partial [Candidatus Obscuribacterales bacterium]|nr:hypothetical protein [Candidatus Obscuribacterales bacterium]